jgi:trigger factor
MKIQNKKIDDLNYKLTLELVKEDYAEKKRKMLAKCRRDAELKGFRKGMAPASLIERLYGERVLVDCVNDCISDSLNSYIKENDLKLIGEPLPEENQQTDWNGENFTFVFDYALKPEVKLELSEKDSLPYYKISVSAEAKKNLKETTLKQFGELADGKAAKEDDFIIVDFVNGETSVNDAYVALRNVTAEQKPLFVGLKSGDTLDVDVTKAFASETDRASMLKCTKEELAAMEPVWKMTVKTVKTFVPAKMNQQSYDKIFGEGQVHNAEEFDAKIEERLVAEYKSEADYRLEKDLKDYLVEKAALVLPEEFLKRWVYVANDGKFTKEEIEKEWPLFIEDFKWQLIRDSLMETYKVTVTEDDILASAKGFAAYQYAMYGLNNVPDEQIEQFAKSILAQEKEGRRIEEQVYTQKTIDAVKAVVSLKDKKITREKFAELK